MKLIATLSAFFMYGVVQASPLHNIVVFGDSLSDNGNFYKIMNRLQPESPPYFEGRFSNGPVWVEHLTKHYFPNDPDSHLLDYAVGGSGVLENDDEDEDDVLFTLNKQIRNYFLAHETADKDSLYVVWIGANNYLGMPPEREQTLTDVNLGIRHGVEKLVQKGAKNIMLINLPNLGKTPAAVEFDGIDVLSDYAIEHNVRLKDMYQEFATKNQDINWVFFDLAKMFDESIDNPDKYGFTNVTASCDEARGHARRHSSTLQKMLITKANQSFINDDCTHHLFFDLVHPTGFAHQQIASEVQAHLDSLGITFKE